MNLRTSLVAVPGLVVALCLAAPAHAAPSYDGCTGTIAALPVVISTAGTWCIKQNLSTSIASGNAITIAGNAVTLDCNGFRISGLAAGMATDTVGISASNKINTTVRNCGVRGFHIGIRLSGDDGAGGLVEDNFVESSTDEGIELSGTGHVVRRNRVIDTGGRIGGSQTEGIIVNSYQSAITDNLVSGMTVASPSGYLMGIKVGASANEVSRNLVTGLQPPESGQAWGIYGGEGNNVFRDNNLLNFGAAPGAGILSGSSALCSGNHSSNFVGGISGCTDAGGNVAN